MARVAVIEELGGPEVIEWRAVTLPPPGTGEVRVRHTAVGVNFIDTYFRTGLYPMALPSGLGGELAGVIEAVGEGVSGVAVGDRVATFGPARGAYATESNLKAVSLFALPDDIDDETAAAGLLKGCTVEFLVERCAKVAPGMTVLVHAAVGGIGLILVQWLKAAGATVIGAVGSDEKVAQARGAGADHMLISTGDDLAQRVRAIVPDGVDVVFDGVGAATWAVSLASCRARGLIASFGNASGPVKGVDLATLAAHGGLFVTRPGLFHYYVTPEERAAGVERVWEMIRSGAITLTIGQRYPLEQAAQAHRDLEARKTTGSTILMP